MTLSFDLADLVQPLVIAVPGVGDLELEVHGDLADWLAAGAGKKVWEESARLSEALGPNHEYIMDVLGRADRVEAAAKATGVLDYLDADTPLAKAMTAVDHTKLGKIGRGLHGSVFNAAKAASVGRGLERLTLAERAAAGIAPSVITAARGVDISAFSAVQKAAIGIDLSGLTAARRAAQGIDLSGLASIGRGINPDLMITYAIGADIARFARPTCRSTKRSTTPFWRRPAPFRPPSP